MFLSPFTSSSRTIDGGLTFLPQPCVCKVVVEEFCLSSADPEGTSTLVAVSTKEGGANTTAVDDIVPPVPAIAGVVDVEGRTDAPAGNRGTVDLALAVPGRRTGPKARAADQALYYKI